MTATTAGPDISAREALEAGWCSPSCLLSRETGRCTCKCQGAYHGILLRFITNPAQPAGKPNRAARRRMRRGRRG